MSTGMIIDRSQGTTIACFYCTTTDAAFGPVFTGDAEVDLAEAWFRDADEDPRRINSTDIRDHIHSWRDERRAELHVYQQKDSFWRIAESDDPDAYLVGKTFAAKADADAAIAAGEYDFIWMD